MLEGGVMDVVCGRFGSSRRLGVGDRYAEAAGAVEVVGEWELSGQRGLGAPVHGDVGGVREDP